MLVTISTSELRLGMFVASINASWWEHPFWRRSFLLKRDQDLEKIRQSGIERLVIDDAKGLGVAADRVPVEPASPAPAESTVVAFPTAATAPDTDAAATPAPGRRIRNVRVEEDPAAKAAETVQRSRAAVAKMFGEARLGHTVRPAEVAPFVEEIAASVAQNPGAIINVCRLKAKDDYTYLHSVAVCALMVNLGRKLAMDEAELFEVGMAGLLHDIGKVMVPLAILDKRMPLDDNEYRILRGHPAQGHKILSMSEDASPIALDVCLHHHERMDGTGYPFGLSAARLSRHARMGAVCDVYDAVTSNRSYKGAWVPSDALARMASWEGHFDPHILSSFIRSIGIYPIGTVVRLSSNRLAMVIAGNDDQPTCPVVRPFYEVPDFAFVKQPDVQIGTGSRGESIMGPESGDRWFGQHWPMVSACVLRGETPPEALNARPAMTSRG